MLVLASTIERWTPRLNHAANPTEKGLLHLEQWAGLGEWEQSAGRKERGRNSLLTPAGSTYSPDLGSCVLVPPSSRDAPAGRPYRPGGGASEATWTRPRPFRNFNGSTSYRLGLGFESLEYLSREAGAHFC